MDFLQLAKKRFSARKYLSKPVEREKLELILEAGRVAPTACNRQPFKLMVIQTEEGLERLKKAAKTFEAPLAILVCADHEQVWKRPYDGKTAADIDTTIITDHLMIEATDLGLDTVWICQFRAEVVKEEFGLPHHLEPINLLIIGYRDGEGASPDRHDEVRKPLSELVTYL